ncbi:MAG: MBL fold metallo-hydrolase [Thaumarchaeota archaeon]|nr:MAG: MBL fold metallo-hydrolase [Nitrososphaerota archaeon]
MLEIRYLSVGILQTNTYLIFDRDSREGVLIDPGDEAEKIMDLVERCGVRVKAIYLTHAHFDHLLALRDLKNDLGCDFYLHKDDEYLLKLAPHYAKELVGRVIPPPPTPDGWIADGQIIKIGEGFCKILHTPGHPPGSVCFLLEEEKVILTGDTLFAGSIGRTDLPGGNLEQLKFSLLNKLLKLPDDHVIYPGHGPSSTIGVEKMLNPFIRRFIDSKETP